MRDKKKVLLDDLAIFGGEKEFSQKLHVGRPNIGNRDSLLARINDALDRRWLTNGGPFSVELEDKIESFLGVKHCILMSNATVGIEILSRALDLEGEVIIPSFTFVATAHALEWLGITPVFCDIDPLTHNLDPQKVKEKITARTSAILGVHVWGRPCAIDELTKIAHEHNLDLIYDAAHAFGSSYKGEMIGNFGKAEVFSFHATKFFNTFEGGAIVTNDDKLASRIRSMRNFGFEDYDTVSYLGTNGKMNEISAAMGITGLESLEKIVSVNRENYKTYQHLLANQPGIKMVSYDEAEKNNFQYIVIEIDEAIANISRDTINNILHGENVLSRRYFFPGCHQMEPYRSRLAKEKFVLPETEKLTLKTLQLPTGTAVGEDAINRICEIIVFSMENASEIQTYANRTKNTL